MGTKLATEQQLARDILLADLKPGDTIYTILRHVSASGMFRIIDLVIIRDNKPRSIAWRAAELLGRKRDPKRDGLRVSGCGMDMGFELVYSLSAALFGLGTSGAYALKHQWL